ncbi:MAG: cobyrinate a,c-diamide synthase [Bacteroidales bacterium]|nr:cobyrinate a,c-diamide synthase [Bacteroidales bacterium]
MKPQLLIGAISSGSGKTTFTMGLLRALRRRGIVVQPFKCGPDYIDTRFHGVATGRDSVNLDTWMASEPHVREVYTRYGADADACIAEGVMGLFDGYDRMKGSAAAIAELLDIPVVLVVNGRSMAYTAAAQLYGMKNFHPGVHIAGVVFNQVSCGRHSGFMEQACRDVGIECFGFLPKSEGVEIPSRHLGLTLSAEREMDSLCDKAADLVKANVDIDRLLKACARPFAGISRAPKDPEGGMRIAMARDASFNFIYKENLDRLAQLGEVSFFSPLANDPLPDADLVYLPGGYPELFADQLSASKTTMEGLRRYAEEGGRVLAECGGMIYLCKGIEKTPMCGVLPFTATMEGARLHLGYRRVEMPSGAEWRGHEFHYSHLVAPDALPSVARQFNAKGEEVPTPLYRYKNVIAGYTHLYWGETDILKLWE